MNVSKLLEAFLGSGAGGGGGAASADRDGAAASGGSGFPSGLAGGAAAGGLVALLLGTKTGRKLGGKALKYGGMAAVGGLAYKAYRDWNAKAPAGQASGQEAQPAAQPLALPKPPADSGFDPEHDSDAEGRDFQLALVRATISAAKSDGHVDASEQARIHQTIEALGLGAAEKGALFDWFAAPADAGAVAAMARTDAQKAEIYLASVLAVDPDTEDERRYLDDLAARLALPAGLRGHLDLEAESARRQMA